MGLTMAALQIFTISFCIFLVGTAFNSFLIRRALYRIETHLAELTKKDTPDAK